MGSNYASNVAAQTGRPREERQRACFSCVTPLTCAGSGESGVDIGRGGVNVPWGVVRAPLPWIDEGAATAKFNALLTALGLQASAAPAWALLTVAEGG